MENVFLELLSGGNDYIRLRHAWCDGLVSEALSDFRDSCAARYHFRCDAIDLVRGIDGTVFEVSHLRSAKDFTRCCYVYFQASPTSLEPLMEGPIIHRTDEAGTQ